jgi:twitching motility protein PilU
VELTTYLDLMAQKRASDLFLSVGAPASIKIDGVTRHIGDLPLNSDEVRKMAYSVMTERQQKDFEATWEMNLAVSLGECGRFRVNVFRQRGEIALDARYITNDIPSLESLHLPALLKDVIMLPRGLVLVVGSTGSGKSTTLAAMIDYRNSNRSGHILTLEDPIEYLFEHKQSIVNQREIGIDTQGYHRALPNALREAPDLIMIGEVRDRETMQHALLHTLTGHLCLSTLHANNSYHALSRIINMFPYDARSGLLSDLSIGLRAIISQRLVRNKEGEQQPAVEMLLNTSLIADLIKNGEITQIKEAMEQSLYPGSQTFEQALCRLYLDEVITYDEALSAADSPTNLAWLVNQNSPTTRVEAGTEEEPADGALSRDFVKLEIDPEFLNRP